MIYLFLIILNLLFFFYSEKIALRLKLIDYPDGKRKLHFNPVPLSGGLIVLFNIFLLFLESLLSNFYQPNTNLEFAIFLLGCCIIFFIGFIDDRHNLSPNLKFSLLLCSILLLLLLQPKLLIREINLTFFTIEDIGFYTYPWTLICFLLFLNAVNMFDGINSQVTSYSIFFLIYLAITTSYSFNCIILIFGLIFFLLKNFHGRAFLGNSGSYLLAFILAYFSIQAYNSRDILFAEEIVLLMIIPGIDLMRLFIYRILKKRSPFSSDRDHLHHYILKKYSSLNTLLIIQSIIWINFLIGYYNKNLLVYLIIIIITIYTFVIFKLQGNGKNTSSYK